MLDSVPNGGVPDTAMIGRERELELVRAAFADAKRNRVPAILRLSGDSGIGKTLFLSQVARDLGADGWFVVNTTCHTIQQHTPRLVTNRIVSAALDRLGSDAPRYTGGLEEGLAGFDAAIARAIGSGVSTQPIDADAYTFSFLRLFEGIAVDHDIAILCDDAQWMDAESARALLVLLQRVSSGCTSLIVAERTGDESGRDWFPSTDVTLTDLGLEDSLRLIAASLPNLERETAEMLAHHGGGRPLELVTLCEAMRGGQAVEIEKSLRVRTAQHLTSLDTGSREFIQLCALLGDPIEQRILLQLYPNAASLERLIAQSERYVTSAGTDLEFRHAMLAQSVASSVAVPIPLHKRIIAGLQGLPALQLTDYERIARHAAICGDTALQLLTYRQLAADAYRRELWSVVIRASEAVVSMHPVTERHDPRFLLQYVLALKACDKEPVAADLLLRELPKISDDSSDLIGELAGALIAILAELEREGEAVAVYHRYKAKLQDGRQLARVASGAMIGAVFARNETLFGDADAAFSALTQDVDEYLAARRDYHRAFFQSATGDHLAAKSSMASALSFSDPARPRNHDMLLFGAMILDFRQIGCEALANRLPNLAQRIRGLGDNFYARLCDAWRNFFIGDWDAALEIVEEAYAKGMPVARSGPLLAIPAAMRVLARGEKPLARETEDVARNAVEGQYRQSAMQLLPWFLTGRRDSALEQYAATLASDFETRPPAVIAIGYVPAGFAIWAASVSNEKILKRVAECALSADRAPWPVANWNLARGLALEALADPASKDVLVSAADDFRRLSAPFMAAYAAHKANQASAADQSLLAKVRVLKGAPLTRKSHAGRDASLTPREWEVARMVGGGATNRQTAEGLFVSERTVEVHLGNIFGKLGVASRAQLVRWLYENESVS